MRILAISDIHGDIQALDILEKFVDKYKPNLLIICGDVADSGTVSETETILNEIKRIIETFFVVPGNCDNKNFSEIVPKEVNLHESIKRYNNIEFLGFGGSNITPFNTNIEFEESFIESKLESLFSKVGDTRKSILVTHCPPKDTSIDVVTSGLHVGSLAIRKIIRKYQPALNLCGHIHEIRGADKIGDTLIINVGNLPKGEATLINIETKGNGLQISYNFL